MTEGNLKDSVLDLGIADAAIVERRSRAAMCRVGRLAAASWVKISGMCPSCYYSCGQRPVRFMAGLTATKQTVLGRKKWPGDLLEGSQSLLPVEAIRFEIANVGVPTFRLFLGQLWLR